MGGAVVKVRLCDTCSVGLPADIEAAWMVLDARRALRPYVPTMRVVAGWFRALGALL